MPLPKRRPGGGIKRDALLARVLARLNGTINERGISQPEIALRSGLTQGHVSHVLNGDNPRASFVVIAKIALAVDVSLDFLVREAPRGSGDRETPVPASSVVPSRP